MRRLEQVNELLRSELAKLIKEKIDLEDGLITISRIKCSSDLKQAKIYISVLPENLTGTALKKLNQHNTIFAKILKKKLNLKYIPRFRWLFDNTEYNASLIEATLEKIKEEENSH
jgi:ribosome-binding factor A